MEVSVETTRGLERRMRVQVPAEKVESEVDSRLQSLSGRVNLKGFRPGKVPLKVVRQQYGSDVRQEVVQELMQSSWSEAIKEEDLTPAGAPEIGDLSANPGSNLEFTATFEVYPEVEVGKTDTLKVTRPVAEIQAADIDEVLERLRNQHARFEPVERAAASGDQVTVDFHGTKDGKGFPGGHGEGVEVTLGEGRMIPGFEDGLEGMNPGDERDIDVTFPDDYPVEDLAGQPVQFHVTVHKVGERRLPELNDGLANELGIANGLDELRDNVRDSMSKELEETVRGQLKSQLMDQLYEANPIDVPAALIDSEIKRMRDEMLQKMGVEDPAKAPDMPDDMFSEQAKKRVALGLLLGELIKREEMKADAEQVQAKLEALTASHDDPQAMIRAYRGNDNAMQQIEGIVLEDQAMDWLLERATVSEEQKSFADVMGLNEDAAEKETA